jgi:hypothetical protein
VNPNIIFPIIAALISVGGIFIAIGMLKAKINHNTEAGKENTETIKTLASKNELQNAVSRGDENLAAAIKRSDEMLELMKKRAEEDRAKGQGQHREFLSLLNGQETRIIKLETQQEVLATSLGELKNDIKSGFKEMQRELKELQNEIKTVGNR